MASNTGHPFDAVLKRPIRACAVALIGGLISGGAVAAFSGDWACAALSAAVVAAALSGLTAYLLGSRTGRTRVAAALAVLILALAFGQVLWIKAALRKNAFRTAFGTDPPATLEGLRVRRHYAGGPGDSVTLMRFRAGTDAVPALVAGLPASAEIELHLEDFRAGRLSAPGLWREYFKSADEWSGGWSPAWWPADGPALKEPLIYVKPPNTNEPPPSSTTILWDRGTGDVYVMIIV